MHGFGEEKVSLTEVHTKGTIAWELIENETRMEKLRSTMNVVNKYEQGYYEVQG